MTKPPPVPERTSCFGCGGGAFATVWHDHAERLHRCSRCGCEWVHAQLSHDPAYDYDAPTPREAAYYTWRADRFAQLMCGVVATRGRLLDVGCGNGAFMISARAAGFDPVGVELTPAAAQVASEATGLPVHASDLTHEIPFGGGSFDVVTLWGVLEHLALPEVMLKVSSDLVRDDGWVLIETPNPEGLFRTASEWLSGVGGSRLSAPLHQTLGAGHLAWFTTHGLGLAAARVGLRLEVVRGTRNSTDFLLGRWHGLPAWKRLPLQAATAVANTVAAPLGRPNQMFYALRKAERV